MRKLGFVEFMVLAACAGPGKEDAKGQVDESEPPSVPSASSKADASARLVATDVQSPHPYGNNVNRAFAVPLADLPSCATSARLHFKVLRTEAHYDFVTVEPAAGAGQSFDGNRDNVWSSWFDIAGGVNVRLETDGSITRHGFEIDQLEWSGAPICPAIVWPACGDGTVDIAKAPGTCQCPQQPVCAPLADAEVSHHLANGRNRTTKLAHGAAASYTHPGVTDGPVTDDLGSIDTGRLAALVRRAAQQGLLQGAGYSRPVAPTSFLDSLTIKAGSYSVTFTATQGAHDAAVQSLIDDFEALFACGNGGGLTCGAGFTCGDNSECVVDEGCVCPALYDPVCGSNGHTYGNSCEAACASVPVVHDDECGITGDACGGFAGRACGDDYKCRFGVSTFVYPHPDAGGTCVAANYCDAPADCNGLAHPAVVGAWACTANACAWQAGSQWRAVENGHFETANPYTNNMSVWKELYLPAEAQALRLRSTRFETERTYDKLEVWSWRNGAWLKVKTYTGSSGPAVTDEWPGQYHYLRFVSDSSVTDRGVSLDAEWR